MGRPRKINSFRPLIGVIISKRYNESFVLVFANLGFRPLIGVIISKLPIGFPLGKVTFGFRPLIGVIISKPDLLKDLSYYVIKFPSPYRGYYF